MDTALNTGFGVASAYSVGAAGKRGYALIKSGAARKSAAANWQKLAGLVKAVR